MNPATPQRRGTSMNRIKSKFRSHDKSIYRIKARQRPSVSANPAAPERPVRKGTIFESQLLPITEVCESVTNAVKNGLPFSLVRYGDGESLFLQGMMPGYEQQRQKVGNRHASHVILRKHLGYIPSKQLLRQLHKDVIQAYKESDILGTPVKQDSDESGLWDSQLRYLRSSGIPTDKQCLAHMNVHEHMLMNNYYDTLFKTVTHLILITSRPEVADAIVERYDNILEVHVFENAPRHRDDPKYNGERNFPEKYNRVREWLPSLGLPSGTVCLIGGGVVGKAYNLWAKQEGYVSLDIGSVFDIWAGKRTRKKHSPELVKQYKII